MSNLASTIQAQGDLSPARPLQEQVLALRRRLLGEAHPHTTDSTFNLYETLVALKDLQAVEQLENQVEGVLLRCAASGNMLKPLYEIFNARRAAHGLPLRNDSTDRDDSDPASPS